MKLAGCPVINAVHLKSFKIEAAPMSLHRLSI